VNPAVLLVCLAVIAVAAGLIVGAALEEALR
jgi:hypothetical protein